MVEIKKHTLVANVISVIPVVNNIRQLDIQARTAVDLNISFESSQSITDGDYGTIKAGGFFSQVIPMFELAKKPTIYIRASSNVDIEVWEWIGGDY